MHSPRVRRFTALVVAGVLHAALIAEMVRSPTALSIDTPGENGSDKRLIASVLLLQDEQVTHVDIASFAPTMQTVQTITLPIPPLPLMEPVAADAFESGDTIANADDLEKAQRLQGIYVKNILDRVTRVMQRVAAGPDASMTDQRCIVHVIQNENGDVLEVDVEECQRESATRERLASAIRAASPLPPPPDGLAMGSYLTLDASTL